MPSSPGTDSELSREELLSELEQTRTQLAEAEDRHLRARADLDNYRRRAERDFDQRVRMQTDDLVRAWLEVIDGVERALALEGDSELAAGLRPFRDQIDAILARQGITRIGAVGERFDPELHEAIAVVPSSGEPGTIAGIARSGYSAGDRVLRPAEVMVARLDDGD
jgi:molecular chaperone GrpE